MGKRNPQVDAYIAAAPEFAAPILVRIRETIHAACPEVEEAIKWGAPHFLYKGMFAGMGAFKQHCAFGFSHSEMKGKYGAKAEEAAGQFGRITSLKDLPPAPQFRQLVKQARKLADDGVKSVRIRKPKPPLTVPKDLQLALKKNLRAQHAFEALSPSHRREYCDWISEAKRAETRDRRIQTTLEWLTEGKSRHWKHEGTC
jgi:uncharacterized protein YdeI (YjbR/CyaY-like superfamily)